ncbi:MAG TPA: MBL fold metallo-hydrolase [Thermomicrobiales bacterium]|jgi:glyoxylase-like metal-dependent hydrolase (beta-lactamase superfamily II)|nr:MBL fold metallo-hydrolase [Thermomicrobiales bacterium]
MAITSSVEEVLPDLVRVRYLIANAYLQGTPDNWVLVDAGLPGSTGTIVDAAEDRFGADNPPEAIILTHGHFDHRGALQDLLERWPVSVYAHVNEIPHLTGRAGYPPPDPTVGGGVMSLLSFAFPASSIDLGDRVRALPDDFSVPGMPGWRWIHTPGHTDGHVSLVRDGDGTLIAGDAFVTTHEESAYDVVRDKAEVHRPPAYFTPDWVSARQSVEALAALRPITAVTGHGPAMSGAPLQDGLEALAANFGDAMPDQGRYVRDTDSTAT